MTMKKNSINTLKKSEKAQHQSHIKSLAHEQTISCAKKFLKLIKKNPPTMKDVKNIIKKFEVLNQINHPCICTAYYINTQETVKDANIDDSKKHHNSYFPRIP